MLAGGAVVLFRTALTLVSCAVPSRFAKVFWPNPGKKL